MNYEVVTKKLLSELGGISNIKHLTHCMTRLRITLYDELNVDDHKIEQIDGVLGVTRQGGQYQVVIGNEVKKCYEILNELIGDTERVDEDEGRKVKQKFTFSNAAKMVISTISGSLSPLIPALIAGGMLKLILIVVEYFNWMEVTSNTFEILSFISSTPYYFMPLMLAFYAAQRLQVTPMLAVMIAGVLLHPVFVEIYITGAPITFFGVDVSLGKYAFSIFPILLMVWIMKYVEQFAERLIPNLIKSFIQPLIIVLISSFVVLIIVGPIGLWLNNGFIQVIAMIQKSMFGWVLLGIVAAGMPLLVRTGMHWVLAPIFLSATPESPDLLILPAMLIANVAQGSAALAVSWKAKEVKLKNLARQAGISALIAGVTEPALYGVNSKLKKPLYATMVAGAIGGSYLGVKGVEAYTFVVPSVVTLPQFLSTNPEGFIAACIGALISGFLTIILTIILWKENVTKVDVSEKVNSTAVYSPMNGKLIPLEEVNDQVFSQKLMGDGVAIIPTSAVIRAPFNGTITALFPTKHAIGLTHENGLELLIHIGINTVELNGEFFESLVEIGDKVKQGQSIIKADIMKVKEAGYDITTPVILTNMNQFETVEINRNYRDVTTEKIIKVKLKEGKNEI